MYYLNLRHKQTNEILPLSFHNKREVQLFVLGWSARLAKKQVEMIPNTKWAIRIDGTKEYFKIAHYPDIILHGYTLEPDYDIENILTPAHQRIDYEAVSERTQESTH